MRAGRSRVTRRYLAATGGGALGAAQFQGAESLAAPQGGALAPLSPTGGVDFRLTFWLAIDEMPASGTFQDVIRCMGVAAGTGGWQILLNGTNQTLRWQTKDTGVLQAAVETVNPMPAGEWLYCDFGFDNSGGAANIAIFVRRASGPNVVSQLSGSGFCGPVHTDVLQMGIGSALNLKGRLSRVGVWLSATTPTPDATWLFNGGAGRTGAEVLASGAAEGDPANLKAYWDLNEATGATTWPDTQSVHPATATGTIVAVTGPPTY